MAPIPPDRQMVIDDTDKASGQKVLSNRVKTLQIQRYRKEW